MSSCCCLVRGSLNNDEYFHVKSIARPGETISSTGYERRAGGKGANQSVAVAKAGGKIDLIGAVGEDGKWVAEYLASFGVGIGGISVVDGPTGRALIQLAEDGENSIILFPGANYSNLPPPQSLDLHITHLLLQNEILLSSTLSYLRLSKSSSHPKSITTIFNPSPLPSPEDLRTFPWDYLDWLIVNEGEAAALYHSVSTDAPSVDIPIRDLLPLLSDNPAFSRRTSIVCTLGSEGVVAFMPSLHLPDNTIPSYTYLPSAKLQGPVLDTTGAGDCFTGYFVQGLMEYESQSTTKGNGKGNEMGQGDLEVILRRCVEAAGMCVERRGTVDSIPTKGEVVTRLAAQSD